jgi:RNA polymerase-interacting CarD/CdnL/TRCF family regulator
MAASDRIFKKGEYIVHHRYGVGHVEGVEKKMINGKKRTFYRVKTNEMTYWLPVSKDHTGDIRKVSAPSTFRSVLSLIRKKPEKIAEHHRSRKKEIKNQSLDLALNTKARIMRDLYGLQVQRELNFQDQNTLEKLKKQFIAEWIVAEDIDESEAMRKLEDALYTSASKVI